MKQKKIIAGVKEKFKAIHKMWPRLVCDFDMKIIHDFRVNFKQLRAFIRLLNLENHNKHAVISIKIKTFYGYIGFIRNVQLQREKVAEYCKLHGVAIPGEYVALLDKEEIYWQKQTLELMSENNFNDDEDKIIDQLPGKLKKITIKSFIQEKLTRIMFVISTLDDDDDLHKIRKILKDLLYTWVYIEPYANLPGVIANEDAIKKFTTTLGEFRDTSIQLHFLYAGYTNKITNEKEKITLNLMKKDWQKEKLKLKKQILVNLRLLQAPYQHREVAKSNINK